MGPRSEERGDAAGVRACARSLLPGFNGAAL